MQNKNRALHSQDLIKLNRVYEQHAAMLSAEAKTGMPFATLVSTRDVDTHVYFHATMEAAKAFSGELSRKGLCNAIAETDPDAKDPRYGYKLYVSVSVQHPHI